MSLIETPVWFITGAATGFGRAFAEHALAAGHRVVATARGTARLEDLVSRDSSRVLALSLDVTDAAAATRAAEAALARFGQVDVLVNNAGYGLVGAAEETPMEDLRAAMETMFFGAVSLTRALLPAMRARGRGAVVMMSSMGGRMSYGGFGAYSAAKFALEGWSEALAQEIAPFGLKLLIVEPGAFRTDFAGAALQHAPILEAYREALGPIRAFAHGMGDTAAGDPAKAVSAIEMALRAERTPLRLQLGADAVQAVRANAEALLAELAEWEGVARATAR